MPDRIEELVDILLGAIEEKNSPKINYLVGHKFPDDDVWVCCWLAKKFIPRAANAEIVFVNAGESLPGSEGDRSVIHFDTGGGEYDQHGKGLAKTSSAKILADALKVYENPGVKVLVDMVTAVDNIEPRSPTDIHYIIEGYPRLLRAEGETQWNQVQNRVFELFDIIYGQQTAHARNRQKATEQIRWTTLPNTLKVAAVLWRPYLREAAFEQGAAVVVFTETRWIHMATGEILTVPEIKKREKETKERGEEFPWKAWERKFYTGIQRNRKMRDLRLDRVAEAARKAEATKRKISTEGEDLRQLGRGGPVSQWFLHDSLGLILNGSRSWEPKLEEFTILSPGEILETVSQALSSIPREVVLRLSTDK